MIFWGAALAGILAGITWFIRDLPGLLASGRTGAIRSKAYGAPLIRREDDAERFDRLVAYRRKQLVWPALMLVGGILLLAFNVFSFMYNLKVLGHP